jgi:hypothetical protein
MKPTRVRPIDLVLIEELTGVGARGPLEDGAAVLLDSAPAEARAPCDFLGPSGCVFPADLRPFGCAAFVCEPMRRLLAEAELVDVEEAVARLGEAHEELMRQLQP